MVASLCSARHGDSTLEGLRLRRKPGDLAPVPFGNRLARRKPGAADAHDIGKRQIGAGERRRDAAGGTETHVRKRPCECVNDGRSAGGLGGKELQNFEAAIERAHDVARRRHAGQDGNARALRGGSTVLNEDAMRSALASGRTLDQLSLGSGDEVSVPIKSGPSVYEVIRGVSLLLTIPLTIYAITQIH